MAVHAGGDPRDRPTASIGGEVNLRREPAAGAPGRLPTRALRPDLLSFGPDPETHRDSIHPGSSLPPYLSRPTCRRGRSC
jgi:hypothetical protein